MVYEKQGPFLDRLRAFSEQGPRGTTIKLEDTTEFAWDAVFVFAEGEKTSFVDQTVGLSVFGASTDQRLSEPGPLLVFVAAGQVAKTVVVLPPLFITADRHRYERGRTELVAHSKDPGPYQLQFRAL